MFPASVHSLTRAAQMFLNLRHTSWHCSYFRTEKWLNNQQNMDNSDASRSVFLTQVAVFFDASCSVFLTQVAVFF
jgi:hypothetical protein